MEKIIDTNYGRTDEFEVVTEWPRGGYTIWNIGRKNFQHPGYLPLAQPMKENKYWVRLDTLKALRGEDEDLCLAALREAGKRGCDEEKFNQIKAAKF